MGSGSGPFCSIQLNTQLPLEQQLRYQSLEVIRRLLSSAKTIAIVGLSADRQKASYFVASYLRYEGYTIIPVNPRGGEILGERVYPDLASIPVPVDIVNVFRPATEVASVCDQAIAIKAKALWTQLRIFDLDSMDRALAAGLDVVVDKCIKMEHGRFGGSLHAAGMNTEILTAQKPRMVRA